MKIKTTLSMTFGVVLLYATNLSAAEIKTNTAQLQAMDKVTGQVSVIEAPVNSEVVFGSFSIVVRECKTRTPEETPENFAYVDVADTTFDKTQYNIFKGWMISSSPAMNAVEHPIYDVWLLKCINTTVDQAKQLTADQLKIRNLLPKREEVVVETSKEKLIPVAGAPTSAEPEDDLQDTKTDETSPTPLEPELVDSEPVDKPQVSHEVVDQIKLDELVAHSEEGAGPELLINLQAPAQSEEAPALQVPQPEEEPQPLEEVSDSDVGNEDSESESMFDSELFRLDLENEEQLPVPAPLVEPPTAPEMDDLDAAIDQEINFLQLSD